MGKTAEQAKGHWCPFARVAQVVVAKDGGMQMSAGAEFAYNRQAIGDGVGVPPAACCVGALCQGWEWDNPAQRNGTLPVDDKSTGDCGYKHRSA